MQLHFFPCRNVRGFLCRISLAEVISGKAKWSGASAEEPVQTAWSWAPSSCPISFHEKTNNYTYRSRIFKMKTPNPKNFKIRNFLSANLIPQMGNLIPWNFIAYAKNYSVLHKYITLCMCISYIQNIHKVGVYVHSQDLILHIFKYSSYFPEIPNWKHFCFFLSTLDNEYGTCNTNFFSLDKM